MQNHAKKSPFWLVRAALTIRFPSGFPFRSLREALDMDPEDVDFAVRGPAAVFVPGQGHDRRLWAETIESRNAKRVSTGENEGNYVLVHIC